MESKIFWNIKWRFECTSLTFDKRVKALVMFVLCPETWPKLFRWSPQRHSKEEVTATTDTYEYLPVIEKLTLVTSFPPWIKSTQTILQLHTRVTYHITQPYSSVSSANIELDSMLLGEFPSKAWSGAGGSEENGFESPQRMNPLKLSGRFIVIILPVQSKCKIHYMHIFTSC